MPFIALSIGLTFLEERHTDLPSKKNSDQLPQLPQGALLQENLEFLIKLGLSLNFLISLVATTHEQN